MEKFDFPLEDASATRGRRQGQRPRTDRSQRVEAEARLWTVVEKFVRLDDDRLRRQEQRFAKTARDRTKVVGVEPLRVW